MVFPVDLFCRWRLTRDNNLMELLGEQKCQTLPSPNVEWTRVRGSGPSLKLQRLEKGEKNYVYE